MKLALAALVLATACSTEDTTSLTREIGECGDNETHVVGVFQPFTPDGGTGGDDGNGTILINVNRPGNHTIVVSAHERANWKIVAANGAKVTTVYAVGRYAQNVTAPAGAHVMKESLAEGGSMACGYAWPGDATCDTRSLLRLASVRLNKHATSFHGCYRASKFTIGEDMAVTSDCVSLERSGVVQSDIVTRCEPDKDESDCGGVVLY